MLSNLIKIPSFTIIIFAHFLNDIIELEKHLYGNGYTKIISFLGKHKFIHVKHEIFNNCIFKIDNDETNINSPSLCFETS